MKTINFRFLSAEDKKQVLEQYKKFDQDYVKKSSFYKTKKGTWSLVDKNLLSETFSIRKNK